MGQTPLQVPSSRSEQGEFTPTQAPPGRLPGADAVMRKSRRENFRVASPVLPAAPFRRLIQANRRDQEVKRYATCDELLDYCRLSADPVGHLVLYVFDSATPERMALSDRVCTGLQIVEHLQDVAEDLGRGRVY